MIFVKCIIQNLNIIKEATLPKNVSCHINLFYSNVLKYRYQISQTGKTRTNKDVSDPQGQTSLFMNVFFCFIL